MRARYSPVAPITLLEQLYELECISGQRTLGDYLLLLAHDVLQHRARYTQLIEGVRKRYLEPFIIMDNGVVELGDAVSTEAVIAAAGEVGADCIISPDVLGDREATEARVLEDHALLTTCKFPIMRVPQGKDMDEIGKCIEFLYKRLPPAHPWHNYWGVPRWVANNLSSRLPVMHRIVGLIPHAQIHLLGMSQNPFDDGRCLGSFGVIGIDSANPLTMGYNGHDITKEYVHCDRGNYWSQTVLNPLAATNVQQVHAYVGS